MTGATTITPEQQRAVIDAELAKHAIHFTRANGQTMAVSALDGDTMTHSPHYGAAYTTRATADDIARMYVAVLREHAEAGRLDAEIASGERTELGLRRGSGSSGSFRNSKQQHREHQAAESEQLARAAKVRDEISKVFGL